MIGGTTSSSSSSSARPSSSSSRSSGCHLADFAGTIQRVAPPRRRGSRSRPHEEQVEDEEQEHHQFTQKGFFEGRHRMPKTKVSSSSKACSFCVRGSLFLGLYLMTLSLRPGTRIIPGIVWRPLPPGRLPLTQKEHALSSSESLPSSDEAEVPGSPSEYGCVVCRPL